MIIKLKQEEIEWLIRNLRFHTLTDLEQSQLYESIPQDYYDSDWQPPDFAYELIRERVSKQLELLKELDSKMEEQTIRGTLNLGIMGAKI